MSPRYSPGSLLSLFNRSSERIAARGRRDRTRRRDHRRDRRFYAPLAEVLENRRLLAVFYRGVNQTNFANTTDESFDYVVDVDNTGTGEIWIRYEALQDRIDIADNPGFGTVTNTLIPPRPGFFGPA
jgi:hypothetical protein